MSTRDVDADPATVSVCEYVAEGYWAAAVLGDARKLVTILLCTSAIERVKKMWCDAGNTFGRNDVPLFAFSRGYYRKRRG